MKTNILRIFWDFIYVPYEKSIGSDAVHIGFVSLGALNVLVLYG